MNEGLATNVRAVLEAWKGIPQEQRPAFNDAAGPLVDALRGLNTFVEQGEGQSSNETGMSVENENGPLKNSEASAEDAGESTEETAAGTTSGDEGQGTSSEGEGSGGGEGEGDGNDQGGEGSGGSGDEGDQG